MFSPGIPAPSLAPLMGQEVTREQGGVRYRTLTTRSLVNRCTSPHVPFQWTVNPFRGCSMGCRYCFAAYTHEFMGIGVAEDFHTAVFVKRGGEQGTARGLSRAVRRGELIALGTATDPYQPAEQQERVTRRFLELVVQHRGVRLGITTKGALILRDVDLLQRINGRSQVAIHVSLISLRADLVRRLEPFAPPPAVRLDVLRRLVAAGLDVSVSVAPVLPALTDSEEDLDALLAAVAATGVTRASVQVLFLRSPTKEKYLRWLAAEFPRYLAAYERAYEGRVYLTGEYRRRLQIRLRRLRQKHGLSEVFSAGATSRPPEAPQQLALWA
jgi:DNA repair photolyase